MPVTPFSVRAYDSPGPGLPESRCVNMFVTPTPAGPTKFALVQRGGLRLTETVGTGPIRGMFQQSGLFGSAGFTVSGDELYRDTTLVGAVAAGAIARAAFSDTQMALVKGGKLYVYDGTTLTLVTDFKAAAGPLPDFIDVIFLAQRFVLLTASGTFYWSDVGDGTQIDALSFATAESSPDGAVALLKIGDEFAIPGGSTVEWWFVTGDDDAPYQRSSNRTYSRGCVAQGSVVQTDNTMIFLGDDRIVYRGGLAPVAISTHGVEARLADCTSISSVTAFALNYAGHPFYILNIPGQATFAYDFSSKEWAEWSSYGETTFRCAWGVMIAGVAFMGDNATGQVWTLDKTLSADGGDPLVRIASFVLPMAAGVGRLDNLTLVGSRGVGLLEESPDPMAELRISANGVGDWSEWKAKSLGAIGERNRKTTWRGLGRIVSPGVFGEVRVTDAVQQSLSGLIVNEARP